MARAAGISRHYGLDWLRIGAFLLLILYHIGLYFSPWHWLVKSAEPVGWVSYPMLFVTPWRLTLLFVVSGYASHAMLDKLVSPGAFARMRSLRLLVPLAFAMAVIIPPQSWIRLKVLGLHDGPFLHFWLSDYFRFGTLHGIALPEWEHLWFVAYLWAYTMLLTGAVAWLPAQLVAEIARRFETLAQGWRLLWIPLAFFICVRVAMTFTVSEAHGLFDDWTGDAMYIPAFLFGFGFARTPALWPAIARLWKPSLVLAFAAYAVLAWVEALYPGKAIPPHDMMALDRAAMMAMMWSMTLVLLHAANTWLNHDARWRAPLSEAVFPVYILHQTMIVVIGWWLLPSGLSNTTQFILMFAGTVISCGVFYAIGAQIGVVRPLIGLNARSRIRPAIIASAT